MKLNICIHNWADYNNGLGNWKWFNLPEETNELIGLLDEWEEKEIFIVDSDHRFITESDDVYKLIDLAENYDEDDLLQDYYNNYPDSQVCNMDEFDDIMQGFEPFEIVRMTFYGEFNPNDSHFTFNGYGNLKSLSEGELTELEESYLYDQIRDFLN